MPQDRWYELTSRGTRFGSVHAQVEPLASGEIRIRSKTRARIDLLGQRQEMAEELECVTDADLNPVSCRYESTGMAGAATVTGRAEGQEFRLVLKRGELELERRILLRDGTIFAACLPLWLSRQPAPIESAECATIDTPTWFPQLTKAKRLKSDGANARWEVAFENGTDGGVWTIDPGGSLLRADMKSPNRELRRAAAKIEDLEYLTFTGSELLMFPLDRDVHFPERLKSLTVRLRWRDVPLEDLQLEDIRQHMISHTQSDGHHEALLQLEPPGAIEGDVSIPVSDPQFSTSLAESVYLRPHDPSIAEQARKWAGDSTTAHSAVLKLSEHVSKYLEGGSLIAETLSGTEVLACKQGKCSEFSTLLASLARSLGVPARLALGMRIAGGRWVGHMWCEVWIGRWVPVDATVNEVGGSPALLKLTHSDTVAGTQPARWALADSLEISIQDVQSDPSLRPVLKTDIVRQAYTNGEFGCRITAPGDDWKLEDKSQPGSVVIQFHPPGEYDQGKPLIHFVAFSLPLPLEAKALVTMRDARFKSRYAGYEVLENVEVEIEGCRGRRFVFKRHDNTSGDRIAKTIEYLWIDGNKGYLLNLIAEERVHIELSPQFERLLDSVELVRSDDLPNGNRAGVP